MHPSVSHPEGFLPQGYISTKELASSLACNVKQLLNALARGDLEVPKKRFCGCLCWSPEEQQQAKELIFHLRKPGRPKGSRKVVPV